MNEQIVSQHNARNFVRSAVANNLKWEVFPEFTPTPKESTSNPKVPAELYNLLKDTTDYGWYTTR
jgi:ribosome-binding factor A